MRRDIILSHLYKIQLLPTHSSSRGSCLRVSRRLRYREVVHLNTIEIVLLLLHGSTSMSSPPQAAYKAYGPAYIGEMRKLFAPRKAKLSPLAGAGLRNNWRTFRAVYDECPEQPYYPSEGGGGEYPLPSPRTITWTRLEVRVIQSNFSLGLHLSRFELQ